MKQSAEPKGRPSANGAGNPPAAIDCLLANVTRTNPQVSLGSSFSKVRISSAVSSSVTGVTFGEFCDLAASEGTALTTPLVDAVEQLSAPERLRVRIGIATGPVVVGDLIGAGAAQEQAVVGETPNLAARLQALADPGAVVIAQSTHRLTGGLFEYEDLGAVAANAGAGVAGAVRAPSRAGSRR